MAKALSVTSVVSKSKMFKNKRVARKIIYDFFKESALLMGEGEEIRFPGNGNGKMRCVIKHNKQDSFAYMKAIGSLENKNPFAGDVKPTIIGFEPGSAGRVKKKHFPVSISFTQRTIRKFNEVFSDMRKRMTLPEEE